MAASAASRASRPSRVFYIFKRDPILHPKHNGPLTNYPIKQIWSINQENETIPYMVFSKSPDDTKNMMQAVQVYKTVYNCYPNDLNTLYNCMTHFYGKKIKGPTQKPTLGIASIYLDDIQNWAFMRNLNMCLISEIRHDTDNADRFTFPIEMLKASNSEVNIPPCDDSIW